jgi:hypothetical protein
MEHDVPDGLGSEHGGTVDTKNFHRKRLTSNFYVCITLYKPGGDLTSSILLVNLTPGRLKYAYTAS